MSCYSHECMSGVILDGKKVNQEILNELRPRVAALAAHKRPPALAVVLVGNNPASQIYVRNKVRTCHELGIRSVEITPDELKQIHAAGLTEDEYRFLVEESEQ